MIINNINNTNTNKNEDIDDYIGYCFTCTFYFLCCCFLNKNIDHKEFYKNLCC